MSEISFARRVAPAFLLAVAGGVLLWALPSGPDSDLAGGEDLGGFGTAPAAASGAASSTNSTPSSPAQPSSAASQKRVIQGDVINFRYGKVQAKVAMDGTTLANIATITAPGGGYQQYTDLAIPTMKARILAAQSTNVATVSGATYTSRAYAQSVQSALDRA